MNHFPILYTTRLILRKIQVEDLPALIQYANNKKIADNIVNIPYPYREPDAAMRLSYVVRGFKDKTRFVFAIIHKERAELIGEISLHLMNKTQKHTQLAYWVGEPFWNQGIATEAIEAIVQFGFKQLSMDLIYADCSPENKASQKALLKNRFLLHTTKSHLLLYRIKKKEYDLYY